MSLPLKLNFSDYDKFLTDPNYTTSAEAQDYFRNMDMLVEALIDVGLWQPETNYPNGHVVFSPNMPNGAEAVCVATNGGKSSNAEPSWGEVGGDNVSDGTCFWKLRWKHWSKSVASVDDMLNGTSNDKVVTPYLAALGQAATNRLPNATYKIDDVVYHKSNLSVALKCTTSGTTSNTELDISGKAVGSSVTDGSVVWKVVKRDLSDALNSLQSNVNNALLKLLPVGTSIMYMGGTVPDGYLAEDGAAVNRTTYAALFAVIGTKYGSGNGSTTFNLPNMGSNVISEVSTGNLAVKGNGKTLGLTNGSANGGLETYGYQGVTHLKVITSNYNINVKSTNGTTSTDPMYGGFGITTDGSKSGMVVPVTATKTTVKYCIKY